MNITPTNMITLSSPRTFQPIRLASDDFVPTSMVLIIAFPYIIESTVLSQSLAAGLEAFPHLHGTITGISSPFSLTIEPSNAGIIVEVVESSDDIRIGDVDAMTVEEHFVRFAPTAAGTSQLDNKYGQPLFQTRLTTSERTGISVLGLLASHMAVDGTGLALFLQSCTASIHGTTATPVFHDRQVLSTEINDATLSLPYRYVERANDPSALQDQWAIANRNVLATFTVSIDAACEKLGANTIRDARFALAATLGEGLKSIDRNFSEIALWCDPRGTAGIPKTYTGNTGCYVHFPIAGDSRGELARELATIASREGFARIAKTYVALKSAESRGRTIAWDGLDRDVIPVNLVPYAYACADFGQGLPCFGRMLTRNSHGLRVWLTPDRRQFVVDVCLPSPLPQALIEYCRDAALTSTH